ncbi:MAG: hypothetical protein Q4C54_07535 [Clostridia bacterium]|nr:hypothetical protein [Clostridia bacterium]
MIRRFFCFLAVLLLMTGCAFGEGTESFFMDAVRLYNAQGDFVCYGMLSPEGNVITAPFAARAGDVLDCALGEARLPVTVKEETDGVLHLAGDGLTDGPAYGKVNSSLLLVMEPEEETLLYATVMGET